MIVEIARIPDAGQEVEGVEPTDIMELDEEDVRVYGNGDYRFLVRIVGDRLLVSGRLGLAVSFRCCKER